MQQCLRGSARLHQWDLGMLMLVGLTKARYNGAAAAGVNPKSYGR
jgi:hypothetical protein